MRLLDRSAPTVEKVGLGDAEVRQEVVETTPEEDAFYAEVRGLISKLPESEDVTVLVLRAHRSWSN